MNDIELTGTTTDSPETEGELGDELPLKTTTTTDTISGMIDVAFTDGTAKFILRDMRCRYELGDIVAKLVTPKSYEYLIECDGSTVSADNYPRLSEVIKTLPNLNGRVLQGASTAGTYLSAGLPNPDLDIVYRADSTSSGVYVDTYGHDGYTATKPSNASGTDEYMQSNLALGVNAWLGAVPTNSIYGASDTVQPPAYTVKYYICAGG
jgi:hypothetical protein